jgi:predicted acetyltransferase
LTIRRASRPRPSVAPLGPPLSIVLIKPDREHLPGFHRWLWDGEFCGVIGFRGYAVVAWKRGRGYASQALGLFLPAAAAEGLPWVELTTDADNIPSQRVILNNGGYLVERFSKPAAYGGSESLRYRIDL